MRGAEYLTAHALQLLRFSIDASVRRVRRIILTLLTSSDFQYNISANVLAGNVEMKNEAWIILESRTHNRFFSAALMMFNYLRRETLWLAQRLILFILTVRSRARTC